MSSEPELLDDIVARLNEGKGAWRKYRTILRDFGYQRRRQAAVTKIRAALDARGLETEPPLSSSLPQSAAVKFSLKGAPPLHADAGPREVPDTNDQAPPHSLPTLREASITVRALPGATVEPAMLSLDSDIAAAISEMEVRGSPHVLVVGGKYTIKGIVSLGSIVDAQLSGNPASVKDCMETEVPEVKIDDPLLDLMPNILHQDATLVRNKGKISGLITPADVAKEVISRTEPFLLLGEIENLLKWVIRKRKLDVQAILEATHHDGEIPSRVDSMEMGDIERIIQHEEAWKLFDVPYDRKTVATAFTRVRESRNALMHFRKALEPAEVEGLRNFLSLVRKMCISVEGNAGEAG